VLNRFLGTTISIFRTSNIYCEVK